MNGIKRNNSKLIYVVLDEIPDNKNNNPTFLSFTKDVLNPYSGYKIQKNDVVERLVIDPTLTPDLPVPDTTRSPTIEQRETSSEEDSIQFIEDNPSRAVNVLKISRKKSLDSLQQTPTQAKPHRI